MRPSIQIAVVGIMLALVLAAGLGVAGGFLVATENIIGWVLATLCWWISLMIILLGFTHGLILRGQKYFFAGGEKISKEKIRKVFVSKRLAGFVPVIRHQKKLGDNRDVVMFLFWSKKPSNANTKAKKIGQWMDTQVQFWETNQVEQDSPLDLQDDLPRPRRAL